MVQRIVALSHSWALTWLSAVFLAVLFLEPLHESIGRIEGRLWPVATGFEVTKTEEVDGRARLSGVFNIERPSFSEPIVQWYLSSGRRETRIRIDFLRGAKLRTDREQEFREWQLDIPVSQLERTRAVVLHQCPNRPWLTETVIFP